MVTQAQVLSPVDNAVLTSRILFNQFQNNSIDLTPATGFSKNGSNPDPSLLLDGSSRGYINGSVKVTAGSPSANMHIFNLPKNITIPKNYVFPVTVLRGGAAIQNAVELSFIGSGIADVNVSAGGTYTSIATPVLAGAGSGAVLVPSMGVAGFPALVSSGTGYKPGESIMAAGGAFSIPAVFQILHTKVVSATVGSPGSGGTDGTQTVTGVTGVGVLFTASVTIVGGAITAVNSISNGGSYSQNPTLITNEPVSGAGLTGATLSVVMGVLNANLSNVGSYTTLPSNPIMQSSSSGSGVGASFNVNWQLVDVIVSSQGTGYDNTSSITFTGTGSGAAANLVLAQTEPQVSGVLINAPQLNDIVYLDGIVFFTNSYIQ
jgi:hypothetical protein